MDVTATADTNEYKVRGNLSLTKKYFLWLFLADRSLTKRLPVRVWVGGNMSADNASYMQSLFLCVFIVAVSSCWWVILKYHQHVLWTLVFSTAGAGVHGCELMWFSERRMSLELVRLVLPPHLVHQSIPDTISTISLHFRCGSWMAAMEDASSWLVSLELPRRPPEHQRSLHKDWRMMDGPLASAERKDTRYLNTTLLQVYIMLDDGFSYHQTFLIIHIKKLI